MSGGRNRAASRGTERNRRSAPDRIRTCDLRFRRLHLYSFRYRSAMPTASCATRGCSANVATGCLGFGQAGSFPRCGRVLVPGCAGSCRFGGSQQFGTQSRSAGPQNGTSRSRFCSSLEGGSTLQPEMVRPSAPGTRKRQRRQRTTALAPDPTTDEYAAFARSLLEHQATRWRLSLEMSAITPSTPVSRYRISTPASTGTRGSSGDPRTFAPGTRFSGRSTSTPRSSSSRTRRGRARAGSRSASPGSMRSSSASLPSAKSTNRSRPTQTASAT
jgi:hypothetical protein